MRADDLLERIRPDQRLLLQAVLRRDDRSLVAYREWRRVVVIEDIDGESHRLMPLLARRLDDIGPDDPVRDLVRGIYRHAWVKSQLMAREAAAAATALQGSNIDVLALKGAALVPHYGGDWGSRPMFDLDLLVRADALSNALDVLDDAGWRPLQGRSSAWVRSRLAARRHSCAISRDGELEIDLHWHVLGGSLGPRADDRFWADAVPLEIAGASVLALSRPDLLLHVLVHGTRDARRGYVQWVADAVHVLRSEGGDDLAPRLAQAAREHGQVNTVRAALQTVEHLIDEPQVAPLLAALAHTRPTVRERATSSSPRSAGVRRALAAPLKHDGGGRLRIVSTTKSYARSRLDLDLVGRPAAYLAYVVSGRRTTVAGLVRRAFGSFARTPTSRPAIDVDEAIDFSAPEAGDAHAAFGWDVADDALVTRGREARLVFDVPAVNGGALTLHLDVDAPARHRALEVRVNERVVARLDVAANESPVAVEVPAGLAHRFQPMEVALLAARRATSLRRDRVDTRLRGLRITASLPPS